MANRFEAGERIVYIRDKISQSPGKRAKNVHPAPHGDTYTYEVEKFWIVDEVLPENRIIARTRRGKRHSIPMDDPRLRKARWWEKLLFSNRFPPAKPPQPQEPLSSPDSSSIAGAS